MLNCSTLSQTGLRICVFILVYLLINSLYFSPAAEAASKGRIIKNKNSTKIVTYTYNFPEGGNIVISKVAEELNVAEVRVVTYNIQHGEHGLERIRDILKASAADVIALNEVDNGRKRSKFVSQAAWLAKELNMSYYFGAAKDITYGNALLSRYPISEVNNKLLSSQREDRGCLTGLVQVNDLPLRVFVTHLGLIQEERLGHIGEIKSFMNHYSEENQILLGDFNVKPFTPEIKLVTADLVDAFGEKGQGQGVTYPYVPGARIDYIFVSPTLKIQQVQVLPQIASDHQPDRKSVV